MKAQATAVTEQPPAVTFVINSMPLETFTTLLPSVICTTTELQLQSGTSGRAGQGRAGQDRAGQGRAHA